MTNPSSNPGVGIPLRSLTAWALLALAGATIFFAFLIWVFPPSRTDLLDRFRVDSFTGTTALVAPLLAVLVAGRLGAPLPQARLVGLVAVIEYAVALLLGSLAFLTTIASQFDDLDRGVYAFGGVLQGIGDLVIPLLRLCLLALAGLWSYQIFADLGGRLPRIRVQPD